MNCYATLTQLKADLGISGTSDDTRLLAMLEAASRHVDNFCDRHFYVKSEARYFDGGKSPLLVDDLLSITTLKLDNDQDLAYEDIMAATDYELYPLNTFPKGIIKISADSDYADFAEDVVKGVEIDGDWGYGNGLSATPYKASGTTVTVANATSTAVTAGDGTKLAVGQTILAGSEQMFIRAISGNNLTVERAVNGTTGSAHAGATAYIYEYPDAIVHACIMIAARMFGTRGKTFESERLGDYSYKMASEGVIGAENALLNGYRRMKIC